MLFDALNMFSEAQAITGTAASQKVIDLGPAYPLSGNSNGASGLEIALVAVDTFAPTTATLSVEIRTSNTLTSTGALSSPTVMATTAGILATELRGGKKVLHMPRVPITAKRYVDLNYKPSATLTAGTITAGLVVDRATV